MADCKDTQIALIYPCLQHMPANHVSYFKERKLYSTLIKLKKKKIMAERKIWNFFFELGLHCNTFYGH